MGHKWKPIEGLPEDTRPFRDRELEALEKAWKAQREVLSQEQALADLNLKLKREWSIETGVIEGVYTLSRGVTQLLIERGIDAAFITRDDTDSDPEFVTRTILNHLEVLDGLFAFVKSDRPLSTSYIKELHAALLRSQDAYAATDARGYVFYPALLKGEYKTQPNSPTREDGSLHAYCPPEHVASEMDRLIEIYREQEALGLRAELRAAWLHHAFTQVHPFQDGNGRVARTLASLVLLQGGLFTFLVTRDTCAEYIAALELADEGDLEKLVRFTAIRQKVLMTQAIGLAFDKGQDARLGSAGSCCGTWIYS